jgi:diketogulonate reductase-like aldo/keto reductase
MELPQIGLGTWELRGEECTKVVKLALELGYRHIDTAYAYANAQAISKALKGHDRSQIYITSKIAVESQVDKQKPAESVRKACESALKELGTDYLDLYLIHWPRRDFPLDKVFMAMEKLVEEGKIGKAGVSNFNTHHLEDLRKAGLTPYANQVEFHPFLNQKELLDYCQKHHIKLISYRSLGKGKLLREEPLFDLIGEKYGKTGAQVVLRWLIQKEIAVIPKASSKKHLQENLDIMDFSLSQAEMHQLDNLHQNKRYTMPDSPEYLY